MNRCFQACNNIAMYTLYNKTDHSLINSWACIVSFLFLQNVHPDTSRKPISHFRSSFTIQCLIRFLSISSSVPFMFPLTLTLFNGLDWVCTTRILLETTDFRKFYLLSGCNPSDFSFILLVFRSSFSDDLKSCKFFYFYFFSMKKGLNFLCGQTSNEAVSITFASDRYATPFFFSANVMFAVLLGIPAGVHRHEQSACWQQSFQKDRAFWINTKTL